MTNRCGHIAQLVERLNGIQEVRGSSPLMSTDSLRSGIVAQLVRALPCQGRGRGFKSRRFRTQSPLPQTKWAFDFVAIYLHHLQP